MATQPLFEGEPMVESCVEEVPEANVTVKQYFVATSMVPNVCVVTSSCDWEGANWATAEVAVKLETPLEPLTTTWMNKGTVFTESVTDASQVSRPPVFARLKW
jgi:hypothetical protein